MTIQRVHHAQITIPSTTTDLARQFYCGVLGFTEIPKPDSLRHKGGFWVQLSNLDLHISLEDGIDRTATKVHLAYQVDDLAEMRQLITAEGLTIKESIPFAGFDRFECRDPFGNRIEFIQPYE